MRGRKRGVALALCCLLLLLNLTPALADRVVYYVAVENSVLPLADDTMPFWSGGNLYISSGVFTETVRQTFGISCTRIGESGVVLYNGRNSLLYETGKTYALDDFSNTYQPGSIQRDGVTFVPLATVARCFDLDYSVMDVEHGYLVWIHSTSFQMQDRAFANAAAFQLNSRYQEYLKNLEPEEPEVVEPPEEEPAVQEPPQPEEPPAPARPVPEPPAPTTPAQQQPQTRPTQQQPTQQQPAQQQRPTQQQPTQQQRPTQQQTQTRPAQQPAQQPVQQPVQQPAAPEPVQPPAPPPVEEEPPIPGGREIYLCFGEESATEELLSTLEDHGVCAAVFTASAEEQGGFLRRLSAAGHSVGLLPRAEEEERTAAEQLEAGNQALERSACRKTRLVRISGDETEIRAMGFCPLVPTLDRTGVPLTNEEQAKELLLAVSRQTGPVSVWLEGGVTAEGLEALLSAAEEIQDTFFPLRETAFP